MNTHKHLFFYHNREQYFVVRQVQSMLERIREINIALQSQTTVQEAVSLVATRERLLEVLEINESIV